MADEKQNEELQIPIEWDYDKFKNSAEFRGIKRNKKGQFVPNNEQLRLLVKHEEIKLSEIDTSEVTDMSRLFEVSMLICRKNEIVRQDFSGIGDWDTSKVETFERMFYHARKFNENISGWDTSSAKNFRGMFWNAIRFNQPIGKWNTSNVTDMSSMFRQALNFNQPLSEWDTSSVTNMSFMFFGTKFNQNINDWNVSRVTDFSYMFGTIMERSGGFNQPLDKWDVSSAENMSSMFRDAINFKQDLSAWGNKLGKLQDMCDMFSGVGKYDSAPKPVFSSVVRNPFYGIGEKALEKINCLESWTVPKDCKIVEPECNLGDKELEKIVESLKEQITNSKHNFSREILYKKLTNPKYVEQMRMLEKALKTPKTRVGSFYGLNVSISILEKEQRTYRKYLDDEKRIHFFDNIKWIPKNIKERFITFLEKFFTKKDGEKKIPFLDDRQWIPENIQRHFRVFLEENGKKGEIKTWDTAYCEIFGLCFKIERYKNEKYKNEGEKKDSKKERERRAWSSKRKGKGKSNKGWGL